MQRNRSSMIKKNEFEYHIKTADEVCYWYDYLKLNLKEELSYFSTILNSLDTDNSNDYYIEVVINKKLYNISCVKVRTQLGDALHFSIVDNDISYTIGQYLEYTESNRNKLFSYWSVDMYWTYFQLCRLWKIKENFFQDLVMKLWEPEDVIVFNTSKITRADYKIDFCYNTTQKIPEARDVLNVRSNADTTMFWKWMETTNWSYWSKRSKYMFLRFYDKLIDVSKKMKQALYLDFLKYKSVFRFEMQASNKFLTARGNGYTIDQLKKLEGQFLEYLWLKEKTWNFKKDYWNAEMFEFYDEFKKDLYIRKTASQATTVQRSWIPALQMIADLMIQNWIDPGAIKDQMEKVILDIDKRKNDIQFSDKELNIFDENNE